MLNILLNILKTKQKKKILRNSYEDMKTSILFFIKILFIHVFIN